MFVNYSSSRLSRPARGRGEGRQGLEQRIRERRMSERHRCANPGQR
jgi:hypothetical protein